MKHATLVLALAIAAAGCHDHDHGDHHHDTAVLHTVGPWYVRYDNGHPLAADSTDPFIRTPEEELFNLVNAHRVARGIPPLIHDEDMRDVARAHSIHMSIADFTGTINPEGDAPDDRASLVGIPWTDYAENIAYGLEDPGDVFDEWMSFSGYHDNVDDPTFTHAGVGYEHDAESIWNDYWTMDFRR